MNFALKHSELRDLYDKTVAGERFTDDEALRLFSPDMLIPMLFGPKKPHLQGPPLTEPERKTAAPY